MIQNFISACMASCLISLLKHVIKSGSRWTNSSELKTYYYQLSYFLCLYLFGCPLNIYDWALFKILSNSCSPVFYFLSFGLLKFSFVILVVKSVLAVLWRCASHTNSIWVWLNLVDMADLLKCVYTVNEFSMTYFTKKSCHFRNSCVMFRWLPNALFCCMEIM